LSYYGARQFAEAATILAAVVRSQPLNIELRKVLAQSCLLAKNYSCAQDEFHQIVQQDPNSGSAHILLGEALDGLGRTPEAIAEFQAAAKVAPQEPDVNFGLGYLQWKSGHFDEAKLSFQNELALDPNHAQALAYLGDIAMKEDNFDQALPYLQKAVRQRNDLRIAYVDLGAVLMQQKRYPEAMTALQQAIRLDPSQPDAHFRLGRLYQVLSKPADADREFAKVRELHEKADDVASQMSKPSAAPEP
jgi:tetratricopeptide (TPR) repeat protein